MKVSINAIRFINQHYGSAGEPAPKGVNDLVQKIGAQLGAVEETIPFGERFNGALIAKVVSCQPHPNADRLHVCRIDDGGVAKNVERGQDGLVQVVCGAPNVRAGLRVVWLPPGAVVPSTFAGNQFVLEAKELRGVVSNGMLASAQELAISDDHDGILEIEDGIVPGTTFTDAYHLTGDIVLDIENKMFTHRPDLFGWLGLAREIEGIQHRPYKSPAWYTLDPEFPDIEASELKLEVINELPQLVPRFTAIALRGVKVGPSPVWLQADLARMGMRSINNIVDYTNFYMVLTGQPLHAYDYDKLVAQDPGATHATITVRHPHKDEKITLLGGKLVEPRAGAIMIATKTRLIGVGGIMGGADTEVDATTKNIVLECGNFDMYSVRRTSMAHGLFTDAATRFTKAQSPLQNLAVLAKITDQIRRYAGGNIASPLIDINHVSPAALKRGTLHPPVRVTSRFINQRLGLNLSAQTMAGLLTNVEFTVQLTGDELEVTAPFWRTDISIPEDMVEEVGRLYGYDHLPMELPRRDLTPAAKNPMFELKRHIRTVLASAGANEVLTYSFVHGDLLAKVGQDAAHAYRLSNALSPDLQYYRLSLMPSLLEKVHPNIKAGFEEFVLFEMNKVHPRASQQDDDEPVEQPLLGVVVAASDKKSARQSGAPYFQAKAYLEYLAARLGLVLRYEPLGEGVPLAQPYAQARAAAIKTADGQTIGVIGEFRPGVVKALKLPQFSAGFELNLDLVLPRVKNSGAYRPLSRFPATEQDMCFKVDANTSYAELFNVVAQTLHAQANLTTHIAPLDIYQSQKDDAHKNITLHITLRHNEKTLTTNEVNALLDEVVTAAHKALGAQRI